MLTEWKELLPILPIVTFIGGYLLSNFDRFRESRRKINNMKTILFKEMSENYKLINQVVPSNEKITPNPYLVCLFVQKLSSAVYDKYLDKLDLLRPKQLEKVYDAYVVMKSLQSDCNTYLRTLPNSALDMDDTTRNNLAARATSIIAMSSHCHTLMSAALSEFAKGPRFLSAQNPERGRAIETEKEISSLIKK